MDRLSLYRSLARPAESRILYYVVDGIGGLPRTPGGAGTDCSGREVSGTPNGPRNNND